MVSRQTIVSRFAYPILQVVYFGVKVRLNRESLCVLRVPSTSQGRSHRNRLQTQHLSIILDIAANQVQQGPQLNAAQAEGELVVECKGEAIQRAAHPVQSDIRGRRRVLYDRVIFTC